MMTFSESQIDGHRKIRTFAHHRPTKCEQGLKERIQCHHGVLKTVFPFESPTIETDVPVREFVDQIEQSWYDGVETIRRHLFLNKLDERLTPSQDPAVHDIVRHRCMGIISELMPGRLLEECDLAEEEPERVEPRQEHPRDNFSHAFFSEAKVVATDYG